MKPKKTLSNWLTTRYQLIIRNEENFAEKTSAGFTYSKVILFSVILFATIFVLSLFMVKTVLEKWFDPKYEQMEFACIEGNQDLGHYTDDVGGGAKNKGALKQ